jgi:hypothetical protein
MKKVVSMMLAIVLCLSISTSAFAHTMYYSTSRDNTRTQVFSYDTSHSHSNLLDTYYSWDNSNDHPSIYVEYYSSGHDHGGTLYKYATSESGPYHYYTSSYCFLDTVYTGYYDGYLYTMV